MGNRRVITETLLTPVDHLLEAHLETEGQVVLEAEHFGERTDGASHDWLLKTSQSGYTGTSYLEALPDIDLLIATEAITDSPTSRYPIQFTTAETYTVWLRGYAANAAGDSLYVDLNGQLVSVSGGDPNEWDWANQEPPGGDAARLSIETSGLYTLTTAMREDGFRLDRLLLTTDTTYIPAGDGPAESERQTVVASTSLTTTSRVIVYTYDGLYRLTAADYSTGEAFAYAYDPLGNQTAITETLSLTNTVVTTYTYDAANRLVTARADDDGITWHYTYDANGNLLRQTPGGTTAAEGETRYTYDAANRLVQVELYTGGSYTLLSEAEYNGVGERVSLTTYALGVPQTVSYVMAGGQLLVADDGSQETLYLYGATLIAEYNGEWSYPLRDSNSSVRQTVDENGAVTSARTYKPFGEILQESGAYESAFGFVGAQVDRVSGLLYIGGRYYDPVTGRYLTPNHGQTNPYAPVQGPGLWLLLPLIGIVVAWKGRKSGAGRMLVLVCVMGVGVLLVGCGEVPPGPTPTQPTVPIAPTLPPSTPTNTPTSTPGPTPTAPTPTSTPTLPPPSSTPSPTPSPFPCPTPSDTPTPIPMQPGSEAYELAEMVYWEEGSEPFGVKLAVAWIAVNRVTSDQFPNTLLSVLEESGQFQAYLANINIDAAQHATTPLRQGQWEDAQQAALQAIREEGVDPTGGFLFFGNGEAIGQEMRICAENDPTFQYSEIQGNINTFYYSNKWYRGDYCFSNN